MKLEEILPYVRKGHKPTFEGVKCTSISHRLSLASEPEERLLSDKWGYLPKFVVFREAWEHMKLGNRVIKYGRMYRLDPLRNMLCVWKDAGGDIGSGWHRLSEGIPIEWIDANDFELVED